MSKALFLQHVVVPRVEANSVEDSSHERIDLGFRGLHRVDELISTLFVSLQILAFCLLRNLINLELRRQLSNRHLWVQFSYSSGNVMFPHQSV